MQQCANINEKDSNGYTALWWSCLKNYTELAEILLQNNKINVNLQNNKGWSPFYAACSNNQYECSLLMLQDARVDINMADGDGWSPLLSAFYTGRTKIVQLLISFGRNTDIVKKSTEDWKDIFGDIKSGSTAIDVAKQRNRTDIVQLLEQYQNNPKETQKLWRNQLNLKGKKIKIYKKKKKKKKK